MAGQHAGANYHQTLPPLPRHYMSRCRPPRQDPKFRELLPEECLHHRDRFREARHAALANAEGLGAICFALESLGLRLLGEQATLDRYKRRIADLALKCQRWPRPFEHESGDERWNSAGLTAAQSQRIRLPQVVRLNFPSVASALGCGSGQDRAERPECQLFGGLSTAATAHLQTVTPGSFLASRLVAVVPAATAD